MKTALLTLIFFLLSIFPSFTQSSKEAELTYLHKVSFPRLFKAGQRHQLVQYCTTVIDSVIQGTVHFKKAQIASIKRCQMTMQILSDTIRNYLVETQNRRETKQLIKQALTVYGNVRETSNQEGQLIFQWKEQNKNGQFIISALKVDANKKHGVLTSHIE